MGDIIVTVDFIDCDDAASWISGKILDFPSCHVGLCHKHEYLFPTAKGKTKWRSSGVIYHHFKPSYSISLLGRESEGWKERCVGRFISNPIWRLITEPIYVLRDYGLNVNCPQRIICVDIITGLQGCRAFLL